MYTGPRRRYVTPVHDAGAGAGNYYYKGPKGKKGMIVDYGVENVSEAFTTDTLPCYVSIGSAGDIDAYGEELGMGTTAIGDSKSVRSTFTKPADVNAYILKSTKLPADTAFRIGITAPTGGTPAGIGQFWVEVVWEA